MSSAGPTPRGDFLGRLLERASDAGGSLEPRVPAIFEPAQPPPAAVAGEDVEPRRPATLGRSEEPVVDRAEPAPPLRRTPDDKNVRVVERSTPPAVPPPVARRLRDEVVVRVEPARALGTDLSRPGSWPEPPERRGQSTQESAPEPRFVPSPAAPYLPEAKRDAEMDEPLAAVPSLRGSERERLFVEPSATARAVSSLGEAPHDRARPEPHTVNVSIGRLEIRAAQPGRSPARAAASTGVQPMSLGDYLKQNGGRR